jgi:hypothetical protein
MLTKNILSDKPRFQSSFASTVHLRSPFQFPEPVSRPRLRRQLANMVRVLSPSLVGRLRPPGIPRPLRRVWDACHRMLPLSCEYEITKATVSQVRDALEKPVNFLPKCDYQIVSNTLNRRFALDEDARATWPFLLICARS